MNRIFFATLLLISSSAFAQADLRSAPVKHLYVPTGFDSNDSVEVVVTGHFPNPCYSRNTVEVDVKDDVIKVEITALYRGEEKVLCPQMLVPYKEVVSLGNLQGGNYKVIVNGTLNDELTVEEASSSAVDEHLYAAIDGLEHKSGNDYILRGWRYSPCVELDRVEVVSNGKDTLSVLPIIKQVSDFCPMKMMPVSYPVKLSTGSLRTAEPLIHVRTMDGKSFNAILGMREQK